ncbi:MAG: photosystem I reaction center subunit XII [Cyanothece sp. SIO2G6]|nr:photosystem I reaction center subunit XII [Cyanothece sp. SIO2G6]
MLWTTTTDPVELRPEASEQDLQVVISAAYRHVLGNQHIMESQRLTSAESALRDGEITVRNFVRAIAKSDLYRSLFFESASPYRFIEMNFKHLLGRAPLDQTEIAEHVARYNEEGYEAEIDSYLDGDEYAASFGENVVPYTRGSQTQTGATNSAFVRMFSLDRGNAAHDAGKAAQLVGTVAGNLPVAISAPVQGSGAYDNTGKRFRIVASTNTGIARLNHATQVEYVVSYSQFSKKMQTIFQTGGKVVSVAEI